MPNLFLSNVSHHYKLKLFWLTESYSEGYWKKYTDSLCSHIWCRSIWLEKSNKVFFFLNYQQPVIVNTIMVLSKIIKIVQNTSYYFEQELVSILLYTRTLLTTTHTKKKRKKIETKICSWRNVYAVNIFPFPNCLPPSPPLLGWFFYHYGQLHCSWDFKHWIVLTYVTSWSSS